jgi:hypothetical protein
VTADAVANDLTGAAPLYHTGADGVTYRVHDMRYGPAAGRPPHRATHHAPPEPHANYRLFLAADGTRRNYTRAPIDDWADLTPATLGRQLRASAYLGKSPFKAQQHGEGAGHTAG